MSGVRKIKVLHLQTDTGLTGGVANYIGNIVKSKKSSVTDNYVVVPDRASVSEEQLYFLYGSAIKIAMLKNYNLAIFVNYIIRLAQIIRKNKIECIHAHALRAAFGASFVSLILNIPLVYTNHGVRFTQKNKTFSQLVFKMMEIWVCFVATAVCSIRPFDYNFLLKKKWVNKDKLYLVRTRINVDHIELPFASKKGKLLIGLGSLIDVKSPERFLRWVKSAWNIDPDISAIWVGDGPLRDKLEAQVELEKLPVKFLGHCSKEIVISHLNASHVLLLSSIFEVFPFSVLEANACGVPVVSSKFPGVEDFIVSNETGFILENQPDQEVGKVIINILNNQSLYQFMSEMAFGFFKNNYNDVDIMVGDYLQIYFTTVK